MLYTSFQSTYSKNVVIYCSVPNYMLLSNIVYNKLYLSFPRPKEIYSSPEVGSLKAKARQ